jgi:hypothetical protein
MSVPMDSTGAGKSSIKTWTSRYSFPDTDGVVVRREIVRIDARHCGLAVGMQRSG